MEPLEQNRLTSKGWKRFARDYGSVECGARNWPTQAISSEGGKRFARDHESVRYSARGGQPGQSGRGEPVRNGSVKRFARDCERLKSAPYLGGLRALEPRLS